jgi:RNA polymerase primary sigma factor
MAFLPPPASAVPGAAPCGAGMPSASRSRAPRMIRAPPSRVRTAVPRQDAAAAVPVKPSPAPGTRFTPKEDVAGEAARAVRDRKKAAAAANVAAHGGAAAAAAAATAATTGKAAGVLPSIGQAAAAKVEGRAVHGGSLIEQVPRRREAYYLDLNVVDPSAPSAKGKNGKPESSVANTRRRRAGKSPGEDSVRTYLYEIGEVKLLDGDAEVHLAKDIRKLLVLERLSAGIKETTGREPTVDEWAAAADMPLDAFRATLRCGLRAKERMVAANLRLVVSIAKKYLNRGLTFQDLIQEGSIGLIRGSEKFDADKGFKFSTYATWWIRQAITRAIADHSRPIRLPVHVNDTIAAIKKTSKALESELHRTPSEDEIAERLQLPVEKLRFLARSSRTTISLETPIGRDGGDTTATLGSFIVYAGDTPEDVTMNNLLREDLEKVLDTLTPRESDVIRMRYGFKSGSPKTLEEIGSTYGVTRERIRQIEAKALRKLRHPNRNAVLREWAGL